MPLEVEISMINAIEGKALAYEELNDSTVISWSKEPPEILEPFQYERCQLTGPASGFEIALKFGGLICRIDVTSWGLSYRKSTPTSQDLELVQISKTAPYKLELFLI